MASRIQGITVEIGGDTTKLGNALKSVNDKTKSLQNELKGVNTLLKMDTTNVTLLKQKQDLLNKSIAECREKLKKLKEVQEEVQTKFEKYQQVKPILESLTKEISETEKNLKKLKEEQEKAKKALEEGKIGKEQYDKISKSVSNCEDKIKSLTTEQKKLSKDTINDEQYRDFQREIVATEQKLKNLEKEAKSFGSVGAQQVAAVGTKMQTLGDSITNVGKKLTIVSAAASAALVGVAKSAIDFETAFTGVTKTVEGTDEELENIKEGLFDLSEATASSATDIASVAEAAGQLGVKTENILGFTETMVRLGDSTNLSANEAATAIAQLYNVMGSDINTVDQFGAALVGLGNNAATTEADILNMSSRIGSSGKQVGLTEQEVLALATTLASVGLEAEGGGSAISAVITQIDKDVVLNSGTLKTWANVAGMSVKDFKKLWENDAMSAIQKIVAGMGDASEGGENLNVILDKLGVTSLRQTDTMKRLSSASELMSDMVDISNQSWAENTALTTESSKRYETTAAKLQQVKNIVSELCSKLGEILLPIIQKICDGLSNFVNWLSNLSPAAQKVMPIVVALVAALGPLLIFVGKIISSIGSILTYGPKIVSMFSTIKTAASVLFSFIAANPIILVITAIIAAIILLWNKCEWFRNLVIGMFEGIKNAVITVWNNIKAVWDIVQPYFVALWEGIKASLQPVIESVIGAFQTAWTVVKTIWDAVTGYFKAIFDTIKGIFSAVTAVFRGDFQGAWDAIKGIVGTWQQYFQNIWNGIKNIFASVGNFFKNSFQAAWNGIVSIFSNVGNFFQGIWNTIKNMFTNIGTTIGDAIGGAFRNVVNSIISFAQNTINGFIRSINWAIDVINNIPGVNISRLNELNIPRLKVGMANVPYDDYLALLHKGERVLTAKENQEYTSGMEETPSNNNIDNSFNLTINSPKETSPAENARLLRREIQRYKLLHT